MSGRDLFKRFNFIVSISVSIFSILPKSIRKWLYRLCRNISGNFGVFIRYVLLKKLIKNCGENVSIREMVIIKDFDNLEIGNNVSIHPFCYIDAHGGILIADDVSIAHGSSILSTNHTWENENIPIKYNVITKGKVIIDNDVWIGCGCRILAGVTIHSRAVVAAGAVVTKDVYKNTVVAGVPAKVIKNI